MQLHLLLTCDIDETRPQSCKIVMDFGQLLVKFGDTESRTGLHCVVEDTQENIVNWLKPFDDFVKGNGTPQTEQFTIVHKK